MFSLARYWSRKAEAARDAHNWPAAQKAYARALRHRPNHAAMWVQYGHMLKEGGSPAEALKAYYRADALLPDQADTHIQIGRALTLLKKADLAAEHWARASALSRTVPGADGKPQPHVIPRPPGMPERLRFLALGTTGTCNASCIHCPTGKAETAHSPRGTMPMPLFQKIIDGIADYALPVSDQIAFGLFGDGLVDPLVVQRAEYLRKRLPDVRLTVNTNGASFNLAKHGVLVGLVDTLALHCESLDTETYNYLMQPLRLERVMPKFEEILLHFHGMVTVSVPITTRNRAEAPAIKRWFMDRGAREVVFDPISSRCAEDRTLFDSLALNPHPIRCAPEIMDDLIVDCDGQVLICCQDFQRIEGIGSLAVESFADVLVGVHRENTRKLLAENRHTDLATCSRCYADIRGDFVVA